MRKLLNLLTVLLVLTFFAGAEQILAQDFTFTCDEPILPGNQEDYTLFIAWLTNVSSADNTFEYEIDDAEIGDWQYILCIDDLCLAPGTPSHTSVLNIGESDSVSLKIYADSTTASQGSVTITTYPQSSPGDAISITFIAYFGTGVVISERPLKPTGFKLTSAYPNPFNPSTTLHYSVEKERETGITIHNIAGQKIRELYRGIQQPGSYAVTWDGSDAYGRAMASGIYIYTLKLGEIANQGKMILVR